MKVGNVVVEVVVVVVVLREYRRLGVVGLVVGTTSRIFEAALSKSGQELDVIVMSGRPSAPFVQVFHL